MIELNILKPVIEDFRSFFNNVSIGNNPNCDLVLNKNNFNGSKIILEFKSDNLICYLNNSSQFFFHNNKKVFGKVSLQKNDSIIFNEIEFKIINFSEIKPCDLNALLKQNYDSKVKNNPILKKKIELIEEKIFILEQEILKDV